jgi:hypothetical protein
MLPSMTRPVTVAERAGHGLRAASIVPAVIEHEVGNWLISRSHRGITGRRQER